MKILAIVITYNGIQWIDKCIGSLYSSNLPVDVIVVDNLSTDGTPEYIAQNFPKVELVRSKENLGFAGGNNIGLQKAINENFDYIFLLNQDAWLTEVDTIEKLILVSKENKNIGILSPIHLNGQGDLLDWNFMGMISKPFNEGRQLYSDLLTQKNLKRSYQVSFVNAAAWLITGACLRKVGLFTAEVFPHYGEDVNYIDRLIFNNFSICIIPDSFICHDREDRQGKKQASKFDIKSEIMNFKVNFMNPNNKAALVDATSTLKKLQLSLFKDLLKLDFNRFKYNRNLLKELNKIFPLLSKCRNDCISKK